jgi:hypothetical protein
LEKRGVAEKGQHIITKSIKFTSAQSYDSNFKKFARFCYKNSLDPAERNIPTLINFLAEEQSNRKSGSLRAYSTSVTTTWDKLYPGENPTGQDPLLSSFLQGAKNLDPEPPVKQQFDIAPLLNLIEGIDESHSKKRFAQKVLTLNVLASLWRPGIDNAQIRFSHSYFTLNGAHYYFQTPPSNDPDSVTFIAYDCKSNNKSICIDRFSNKSLDPVFHSWQYVLSTLSRRSSESKDRLYISNMAKQPPTPVVSATLRNWIKDLFKEVGITLGGHGLRSLAATKALEHGELVNTILEAAVWSNVNTFKQFYLRNQSLLPPVKRKAPASGVGHSTLKKLRYEHSNMESLSGTTTDESLRFKEGYRSLIDKDEEGGVEEREVILLIPPEVPPSKDNNKSACKAGGNTVDLGDLLV